MVCKAALLSSLAALAAPSAGTPEPLWTVGVSKPPSALTAASTPSRCLVVADMKHAVGAVFEGIDYSKTNAEKHQIRSAQKVGSNVLLPSLPACMARCKRRAREVAAR